MTETMLLATLTTTLSTTQLCVSSETSSTTLETLALSEMSSHDEESDGP